MIKFETITYKNILSVGQAALTMDLSTHRLTALYGPSGSGKSLFLDALSFALFGRAFRDINKTDLINTINGKGLLVEVEFSAGDDSYKVSRGLKPNVFQIVKNGEPLNQESHAKDQQKYLEDQVLKMNWKIFTHVVLLGAANYTPFMRLKPNERKKMVENILGIDVFSTMNGIIKTKISEETLKYKSFGEKKDSLSQQLHYLEAQQKSFEEKRAEEIKALTEKLVVLKAKKKQLDADIKTYEQDIAKEEESFDPRVDIPVFEETFSEVFNERFDEVFADTFQEVDQTQFDVTELVNERATCLADIKLAKEKLEHANEHIKFYSNHDSCPTCSQSIGQEFKDKTIDNLLSQKVELENVIQTANTHINVIKEKAEIIQAQKKEYEAQKANYVKQKAEFQARQSDFEQRRRNFEEKQRAFENRRRAHEELVKKADLVAQQKRAEFEKSLAVKKQAIADKKADVASLIAEAKFTLQAIEEKKEKPLLDNSEEIQRIKAEATLVESNIDTSAKQLRLLRDAQVIIKDDGVKSEILKRYVPTLNKHINQYLTKMGMFVSFELDQEFNDTIRSRHRDVLSYANYSEGERQRLDLAVLLAWRHLAQAQSAVNTNLLVLDEVLDSYLDQATTETILGLMRGDEFQAFNIVIISHKEGLGENFDRTVQFHKKNNFTAIA